MTTQQDWEERNRQSIDGILVDSAAKKHGVTQGLDRLAERYLTVGPDSLTDFEILQCFLSKFAGRQTRRLVQQLLAQFGSLAGVIAAPMQELLLVGRLGISAAVALKVVHTAARRLERAEVLGRPVLDNWSRLMDYLHAELSRERVEQLRVLYLNNRNCLIADEVQQHGTVNSVAVYPREVAKRALELSATALILVHNHPSGDPTPSLDDIEMTDQVRVAVAILSITLHDHIIVGNGCTVSFREKGLLGRSGENGEYAPAISMPHLGVCREPSQTPATTSRRGAEDPGIVTRDR